jgi:hypothetical protein
MRQDRAATRYAALETAHSTRHNEGDGMRAGLPLDTQVRAAIVQS